MNKILNEIYNKISKLPSTVNVCLNENMFDYVFIFLPYPRTIYAKYADKISEEHSDFNSITTVYENKLSKFRACTTVTEDSCFIDIKTDDSSYDLFRNVMIRPSLDETFTDINKTRIFCVSEDYVSKIDICNLEERLMNSITNDCEFFQNYKNQECYIFRDDYRYKDKLIELKSK